MVRLTNHLSQGGTIIFFILIIGAVSSIALVLLTYFVGQKELASPLLRVEPDRSQSLWLNVFPREIAARIKSKKRSIADHAPPKKKEQTEAGKRLALL